MGYTESNSWVLASENVPEMQSGDFIILAVQAYTEMAPEDIMTDIEKARYLHDGPFTGSAWSVAIAITKD